MNSKVKPVSAKMKKALRAAAKTLAIKAPGLTGESKAYEAWIAFESALALRMAGAMVEARNHHNKQTKRFRVRGNPGNLPNIHAPDPKAACHFFAVWDHKALELHISLKHEPVLRTNNHELDVSVISYTDAADARKVAFPGPFKGLRLMAAELKAYRADKPLDKNIARTLIGLALDLDPGAVAPVIEFKTRTGHVLVSGTFEAPQYLLLTTAQLRPSFTKLLATYGILSGAAVSPGTPTAQTAIVDIVAAVYKRLRTV